jgi:glycosyltransferase involved in cell wall biosynthesis
VRILILIDCYLPGRKSGAKLIHDLGVEFLRGGHEVIVLTTTHEIVRSFEVSLEDGLRIARVKTKRIKGASKLFRALREARLSSFVWRRAGKFLTDIPADLIVFYSPTIFWSGLVRRLKTLWHVPAYLILRDIFPEWAIDVGVLKRGIIYRYFHRKADQQYDRSDIIAVQSPGDLKYFTHGAALPPHRLKVLYNWAAIQEPVLALGHYRVRLGLEDKVVFFYGGNLGVAQDTRNILRLASSLAGHSEIHFLLVGEGSEVSRLQRAIADNRLSNVLILPPTEQRDYLSMVSEFDIGLITLDRRLASHNIPGKLLSYLYFGIPILASVNPGSDLFGLIGKGPSGFCLENGQDEKFRDAALELAGDAHLRARMGRNARALLEQTFSAGAAAQQILQHIAEIPRPLQEPALSPIRRREQAWRRV